MIGKNLERPESMLVDRALANKEFSATMPNKGLHQTAQSYDKSIVKQPVVAPPEQESQSEDYQAKLSERDGSQKKARQIPDTDLKKSDMGQPQESNQIVSEGGSNYL